MGRRRDNLKERKKKQDAFEEDIFIERECIRKGE